MKLFTALLSTVISTAALTLIPVAAQAQTDYGIGYANTYYTQQIYVSTGSHCVAYKNTVIRNNKVTMGKINVRKGQRIVVTSNETIVDYVVNPKGIESAISANGNTYVSHFTAKHSGNYTLLSTELYGGYGISDYKVCIH